MYIKLSCVLIDVGNYIGQLLQFFPVLFIIIANASSLQDLKDLKVGIYQSSQAILRTISDRITIIFPSLHMMKMRFRDAE